MQFLHADIHKQLVTTTRKWNNRLHTLSETAVEC
jgi:hypothetical protein